MEEMYYYNQDIEDRKLVNESYSGILPGLMKAIDNWLSNLNLDNKQFSLFLFIVVTILIGQLSLIWLPVFGVFVEALVIAGLIGTAVMIPRARQLVTSVAILPVAMLITLSLPQQVAFAQSIIFYSSIFILALIYRYMFTLDNPIYDSKLSRAGYAATIGNMIVIGEVMGLLGYALLKNSYNFTAGNLPLIAGYLVIFAIAEEVFFRGLIQQRAGRIMHPLAAFALTVILYTITGIDHGTLSMFIFTLIMGLILSYTYYIKQNLVLTITINATTKLIYVGLIAAFILH